MYLEVCVYGVTASILPLPRASHKAKEDVRVSVASCSGTDDAVA